MKLFGLEKLSLVDFDGFVSATVFTGGCNFRCGFCHNSPLVTAVNTLKEIGEDYVLDFLKSRIGLLEGLCITGGEPTLEKDLPVFCQKVKDLGYKIKLDTNGTNPNVIKTLVENNLIDYVAMDIKSSLSNYAQVIGFSKYDTSEVEKSVEYLINGSFPFEFRTTLIKEFHTEQVIKDIAKWIKGTKKYYMQKFKDVGSCIENGFSPVDKQVAEKFASIISPYVEKVSLRGYD